MKIIPIGEPQIILRNPLSKHNYFAWPTITRLQNGKLCVVASGFRLQHICPFGKTVIAYSEDEGQTYTLPTPVFDTVMDDRDAGILAYGEKNVIVTSFNSSVNYLKKQKTQRRRCSFSMTRMLFTATIKRWRMRYIFPL